VLVYVAYLGVALVFFLKLWRRPQPTTRTSAAAPAAAPVVADRAEAKPVS
jgi:hypothetical protein